MDESSYTQNKAKRQKIDKSGRKAALERLKLLKGSANKCEIGEIENVYEYVDEEEYSKRVLQRQDEDWLENPGDGYFEDGREIFYDDDDDDDHAVLEPVKRNASKKKKEDQKSKNSSKSILHMVKNMPGKKKKTSEESNILSLLDESLSSEVSQSDSSNITKNEVLSSREYLKMLSNATIQAKTAKSVNKKIYLPNKLMQNTNEESSSISHCSSINKNNIDTEIKNNSMFLKNETNCSKYNSQNEVDYEACHFDKAFSEIEMDIDCLESETFSSQNNAEKETKFSSLNLEVLDRKDESCISKITEESKNVNEIPTESYIGWENSTQNIALPCISIDKSDLPLEKNKNGENVFRFYWLDAYEDPIKQPGTVFLFGKVYYDKKQVFLSCCVAVENIHRRIFLLPREKRFDLKAGKSIDNDVTLLDVYREFNDKVATPNKIMNFKSKKTTLKYAFDLIDVPLESDYLEIKYPSTYNKLSSDLVGETFSRVFGTTTSSLELLLIERKIKGPCWLDIENPQSVNTPISWCKFEARCLKPEDLIVSEVVAPPPPMVLMTINILSVANNSMNNEIIMIGVLVQNQYRIDKPAPNPPFHSHFCTITRSPNLFWPQNLEEFLAKYKKTEVITHQAEKSLLNYFLTKLFTIDPDVIIGHDLFGFTLDTLIQRIQYLKIPNWSRLGRLRRAVIPQFKGKQVDKSLTCGRLICDVVTSARELIRARSYDLSTLCKQVLGVDEDARQDFSCEEIIEKFQNQWKILELINSTMEDSNYILKIIYEINVLPLALQITKIAGNVMSKTLLGGRSERNEFLLLHAFSEKNYLVPDKNMSKNVGIEEEWNEGSKHSKKKPQYAGGLVLEPKKGFYDNFILLMDFNSLYPSIIQEYNICFTTVPRPKSDEEVPEFPSENLPLGILPIEIQKLVETRREVKALMKASNMTPELYMQHNIRQMALKLTANSMYGCLGFSHSRFHAKPLAALVTSRGREILINTKSIVERMKYEVIYGDTDSIMINTNCRNYEEVFIIGNKIKEEINKLYKYIELEVDGVFKYMLLLKKKKYAAVVLTKKGNGEMVSTKEYKGLDIVRRDWCQLSGEIGKHVLDQILSELTPEERISNIKEHLERVAVDLQNGKVPMSLLAITKQLTKNPWDYNDVKSLPHLQVALRMNSKGGKKLRAGNTVSYVICDDGTNLPPVQRAYHVDELKTNSQLLVDIKYYLTQQIHPVVSRLCEPIDGVDAAFIAECLGLDPKSYRKVIMTSQRDPDRNDIAENYSLQNDLEAFKRCEPFSFVCRNEDCGTVNIMNGPVRGNMLALSACRNASCKASPMEFFTYINNELQLKLRHHIAKFYQNWLVCEDPVCSNRTQRVPMRFSNSFPVCSLCHKGIMYREFTSSDLYYQLKFYKYIFNVEQCDVDGTAELKNAYKVLHDKVADILQDSAYNSIDFGKIFGRKLKKK